MDYDQQFDNEWTPEELAQLRALDLGASADGRAQGANGELTASAEPDRCAMESGSSIGDCSRGGIGGVRGGNASLATPPERDAQRCPRPWHRRRRLWPKRTAAAQHNDQQTRQVIWF